MEGKLIKAALRKDFFSKVSNFIDPQILAADFRPLWLALGEAHTRYEGDLSIDEIVDLYTQTRVITPAKERLLRLVVDKIKREEVVSEDLLFDLAKRLKEKQLARDIADRAIRIIDREGGGTFHEIATIAQGADNLTTVGQDEERENSARSSTSLPFLLSQGSSKNGLSWPLAPLQEKIGNVRGGNTILILGRPEVGKSSFIAKLAAGFLKQSGETVRGSGSHVQPGSNPGRVGHEDVAENTSSTASSGQETEKGKEGANLQAEASGRERQAAEEYHRAGTAEEVGGTGRVNGRELRGASISSPTILRQDQGSTTDEQVQQNQIREPEKHSSGPGTSGEGGSAQGTNLDEEGSSVGAISDSEDQRTSSGGRGGSAGSQGSSERQKVSSADQQAQCGIRASKEVYEPCRVAYLGNEEPTHQIALNIARAMFGKTTAELADLSPEEQSEWDSLRQNLFVYDVTGWSIGDVHAMCGIIRPHVVIVDQTDKLRPTGQCSIRNFTSSLGLTEDDIDRLGGCQPGSEGSRPLNVRDLSRDHSTWERMANLYPATREVAKLNGVVWFNVTQASAEAVGKTAVTYNDAANSRTDKGAESDVVIGLSALSLINATGEDEIQVNATVSKDKLSGWHGIIPFTFRSGNCEWLHDG